MYGTHNSAKRQALLNAFQWYRFWLTRRVPLAVYNLIESTSCTGMGRSMPPASHHEFLAFVVRYGSEYAKLTVHPDAEIPRTFV